MPWKSRAAGRRYHRRYRKRRHAELLEYQRKWRRDHPEKMREYRERYLAKHPEQCSKPGRYSKERERGYRAKYLASPKGFFTRQLSQVKKRGRLVSITAADLIALWTAQEGRCAITNHPMLLGGFEGRGKEMARASIDRIDSDGDYVLGNIQLVCAWANFAKDALAQRELVTWCRRVVRHAGRTSLRSR